jgi:two-component system, NtrC family, C4-dicarboxylate transport response regulator DctD
VGRQTERPIKVAQKTATESEGPVAQKAAADIEGDGKVLVVDDDEDVRHSFAEILRLAGYQVGEAADFDQVSDVLAQGGVSLLLLDLGLPTKRGLDVLERLENPPKVILMSGSDEPVLHPKASVFLSKPIAPQRLLEEVERQMRERT